MSTSTLEKIVIKLSGKSKIHTLPVPIDLPPLTTETPRQEILRLLDRAVRERGYHYVDRSHTPVRTRLHDGSFRRDYGCIVGYLMGLKGISLLNAGEFTVNFNTFGWTDERDLLQTMIQLNDSNYHWGEIQKIVTQRFPVAA
jgi:hypothetical protein